MKIEIIGVPLDLGADHRGVDMGPSAIRITGMGKRLEHLGFEMRDGGDLQVDVPEVLHIKNPNLKYLPEIQKATSQLAEVVEKSLATGHFPLVLGGDHSIALGTVSGVSAHFHKKNEDIGLIWVDAHGDMNTDETTPSGNIHGMPLAALLGMGSEELTQIGGNFKKVLPGNCVIVGARDIDDTERENIKKAGVKVFTMAEIDRRGIHDVMVDAIDIASRDTAGFHVSFDMDALDPSHAPGVGTPVKGGLTYREAHVVMEAIAKSHSLVSLEIVEVNPILDVRNGTAEVAADLVSSALGKRILG